MVDEIKTKYLEKDKQREDELNNFIRSIQAENEQLRVQFQKKEQEEQHRSHLIDVERRAQEFASRQRNIFAKEREEFLR